MTIWVDAHLSPRIARWITENYPVTALPLREIGLRNAEDDEIFAAARAAAANVLTKDSEFRPASRAARKSSEDSLAQEE